MANQRINHQIKASEVRVIGATGENLGVLPLAEAIKRASELGLDLIEVSADAKPPVVRISDYGKFRYEENKKKKGTKVKTAEVKNIQVKIGTGEHDLALKAQKIAEWIREGNRVKIDLFLPGRTKYMNESFLKERLDRVLKLIPENYKITDAPKKSLKGLTTVVEKE